MDTQGRLESPAVISTSSIRWPAPTESGSHMLRMTHRARIVIGAPLIAMSKSTCVTRTRSKAVTSMMGADSAFATRMFGDTSEIFVEGTADGQAHSRAAPPSRSSNRSNPSRFDSNFGGHRPADSGSRRWPLRWAYSASSICSNQNLVARCIGHKQFAGDIQNGERSTPEDRLPPRRGSRCNRRLPTHHPRRLQLERSLEGSAVAELAPGKAGPSNVGKPPEFRGAEQCTRVAGAVG